jgi:hypothetical protein
MKIVVCVANLCKGEKLTDHTLFGFITATVLSQCSVDLVVYCDHSELWRGLSLSLCNELFFFFFFFFREL